MREFAQLFAVRDDAISKRDRALFLSTQIEEINDASSEGYLSLEKLNTEVIAIPKVSENTHAAFVKETYFTGRQEARKAFLIYFLVDTNKGWKIYRIVS